MGRKVFALASLPVGEFTYRKLNRPFSEKNTVARLHAGINSNDGSDEK